MFEPQRLITWVREGREGWEERGGGVLPSQVRGETVKWEEEVTWVGWTVRDSVSKWISWEVASAFRSRALMREEPRSEEEPANRTVRGRGVGEMGVEKDLESRASIF